MHVVRCAESVSCVRILGVDGSAQRKLEAASCEWAPIWLGCQRWKPTRERAEGERVSFSAEAGALLCGRFFAWVRLRSFAKILCKPKAVSVVFG